MDKNPIIKPIKTREYDVPESRYRQVGKLPFRTIILGSSGSGKTILLQNMIIDIYKQMNEYIYFHQALMLITRRGCLSKNT